MIFIPDFPNVYLHEEQNLCMHSSRKWTLYKILEHHLTSKISQGIVPREKNYAVPKTAKNGAISYPIQYRAPSTRHRATRTRVASSFPTEVSPAR